MALTGSLAGVLLGGGLGALTERARWKRDQGMRLLDERRVAYARLLNAADTYERATQGLTAKLAFGPTQSRERIAEARRSLQDALNEADLVSHGRTRDAIDRLKRSLEILYERQLGRLPSTEPEAALSEEQYEDAHFEYVSAYIAFKDAARSELGVAD